MIRAAFTTNICPHYRIDTFETLSHHCNVDYYFFSAGDDWYWQQEHGSRVGDFHYEYLPGFHLGRTRVIPTLPLKLWIGDYDVYIKCINGRFALPVTYLVARLKRRPFILWTGVWMRLHTPAHRLFFPLTRYIYRHADAIVVYGKHVKRYLMSEGVPSERILVASHAVENPVYRRQIPEEEIAGLRHELGIQPHQKVILYLGRLEEVKGLSYLLEAFASLKRDDVALIVAGTGSKQAELQQIAQDKGITEQVIFPGYIQPEKTVSYYALAYVYVLPSITTPYFKEPWGLVINEAMNQGVPVIATDSVGAAAGGLVQDGINGFIVPERDSTSLAQTLERVLDNPDLRDELGQNARQIVSEWDNERMVLGFRRAIDYVTS